MNPPVVVAVVVALNSGTGTGALSIWKEPGGSDDAASAPCYAYSLLCSALVPSSQFGPATSDRFTAACGPSAPPHATRCTPHASVSPRATRAVQ